MDDFIKRHLDAWLQEHLLNDTIRRRARLLITEYVDKFPEIVEKSYTWTQIIVLAFDYKITDLEKINKAHLVAWGNAHDVKEQP